MKVRNEKGSNGFYEGDRAEPGEKIGNAALMLSMLMVVGAILFLIIAFANHQY
jgi:hypothetical protein